MAGYRCRLSKVWGPFYYMSVNRSANGLVRGLVLALCITSVLLSGCETSRERKLLNSNPAAIYKVAHDRMQSTDYKSAIKLLEGLTARFPFTEQARQARLDLIYCYYKSGEGESATDAADTFIRENPINPRIDYAYYIKGLVDFERTPNLMEHWFRSDLTKRPPVTARKSFDSLRHIVQQFPQSLYAYDSRQRMVYLRNRLANYDVHVAQYYMARGAYAAASQRAADAIEQYAGAPATEDALKILIAADERLGLADKALQARAVYADNFSGRTPNLRAEKDRRWWQIW
jgi:outer membrane protein assembly factor BamD